MLKSETDKQAAHLERLVARKKQILDKELPHLCKNIASMHCWDVIKAGCFGLLTSKPLLNPC